MHRIDGPGATGDNKFTEGDPGQGIAATTVTDDWLNDAQEELCLAIEAAGLSLVKGDATQIQAAIKFLAAEQSGIGGSFRNLLSNASFVWNQRIGAASFPYALGNQEEYVWDRFFMDRGNATVSVDRVQVARGSGYPAAGLRGIVVGWDQTGAGTGSIMGQRTENLEGLDGREVTISFYAKVASGSIQITPQLVQHFGDGGGASGDVSVDLDPVTVTTAWQRLSVTTTVPSITGKTVDGTGIFTQWGFKMPNSVFDLQFGWPQVELGPTAQPWESIPVEYERPKVLRYYQKSYEPGTEPGTDSYSHGFKAGHNGTQVTDRPELQAFFPVMMRNTPTIVWYSPRFGTQNFVDVSGDDRAVSSTLFANRVSTGYPTLNVADSGNITQAHWTADAEL